MGDPFFSPVAAANKVHTDRGQRHYRVDWTRGDELVGVLLVWASDEIDLAHKIQESGTARFVGGDPSVQVSMVDDTDRGHGTRCRCSRCAAYVRAVNADRAWTEYR